VFHNFHVNNTFAALTLLALTASLPAAHAQIATTTTLTSSASSVQVGSPITLTSVVSPFPPTGKVTFYDATTVLGTRTLDGAGTATFATIALSPGSHRLRARFQESAGYSVSESPTLVQYITSCPSSTFAVGQSSTFHQFAAADHTIATADFDGDRNLDFVVGLQSGGIAVFLGNGDGTFQAPATYSGLAIASLATGDLRGTGLQDIVTVSYNPTTGQTYIDRYWNNGDGTFERGPGIPVLLGTLGCGSVGCAAIQIADMNCDGKPDLVFLSTFLPGDVGALWVYLGNGDGTFQSPITTQFDSPPAIAWLTIADFNRDGASDVAFIGFAYGSNGNPDTTPIMVMLGNGDGTFKAPLALANGVSGDGPLVVGDFNRDGIPDLALGVCTPNVTCEEPPWWSIQILLGNGDGTFRALPATPLGVSLQERWLIAADMNGDRATDLIIPAFVNGTSHVEILYGNGDGTFQSPVQIMDTIYPFSAAVAALNQDGRLDLITLEGANPPLLTQLRVLLGGPAAP
jgi:hypothetical protein